MTVDPIRTAQGRTERNQQWYKTTTAIVVGVMTTRGGSGRTRTPTAKAREMTEEAQLQDSLMSALLQEMQTIRHQNEEQKQEIQALGPK